MFLSAGYQATLALRKNKSRPSSRIHHWPCYRSTDKTSLFRFEALVNFCMQAVVKIKWNRSPKDRDLYCFKPTQGPSLKFKCLAKAAEIVISRLGIGHIKAAKSHILSRGYLQSLWLDNDHCSHDLVVSSVNRNSWRILQSWLIQDSLWDDSWDFYSRISVRNWILLFDINGQIL